MKSQHLNRLSAVALVLVLVLLTACGPTRQVNPYNLTPDDLYAQALELHENRRFDRAITFLEVFVSEHLGDPRVPTARMLLGDIHMERREYATAAMHYQRFAADFPTHGRAIEARFLTCEAYYRLSPPPQRDQEYTFYALMHCESISDHFPGTDEAVRAAAYVEEMREKLAQKAFDTGTFYFRRRAYDAAVVYYTEVADRFPDTTFAPAALGQLVETYERIGYVEDAEETRERLLRTYPESPQAQDLASSR
jgi:outer membrane protein assembly factor BamD